MARTVPPRAEPLQAASGAGATSAAPLAFRRDDGFDLPPAGVLLLAILLAIAGWAWWRRWLLGGTATASWPSLPWSTTRPGAGGATAAPRLRLLASQRLDRSARVHVLECDGRRYLVGCNGQHAIGVVACEAPSGDPVGACHGARP